MLLFRSEEHVTTWSERRGSPVGATMTLEQGWRLALAWFNDRLSPDWRRKTPAETEEVFARIGLSGPFWHLT